jgi:hypothetical protein
MKPIGFEPMQQMKPEQHTVTAGFYNYNPYIKIDSAAFSWMQCSLFKRMIRSPD